MDFQKLITDITTNALNSTILVDALSRLNATTTDVTTLATGATAVVGIIMTRNFYMTTFRYAIAVIVAILAYFVSDVVLTKILHLVKLFLCTLAALLIFLAAKTMAQDYFVT